jgi:hypothetical protein
MTVLGNSGRRGKTDRSCLGIVASRATVKRHDLVVKMRSEKPRDSRCLEAPLFTARSRGQDAIYLPRRTARSFAVTLGIADGRQGASPSG